jgi:hypothetical protein
MAIGEGSAVAIGFTPDRLDGGVAERLSSTSKKRAGWPNYTFAFHDGEEIGPSLLARIAKKTGLKPQDL